MSTPVLDARELTKAYGPQVVLDGVSLAIASGERVGLLGLNGCGKSTLGKILSGQEPPDGGEVALRRGTRVERLGQSPELDREASAVDAVLSGLGEWQAARRRYDRASAALESGEGDADGWLRRQADAARDLELHGGWELMHRAEAMLGQLGVAATSRAVGTMSGGEQRRIALARVLLCAPDLCVLDEPTNHLDVDTIEWLEDYLLEQFRGAVLLITHDRYLLDRVVQRTLELSRGRLHAYEGGYQAYLEGKAARLEHEARVEQNRQNFLRTELEWLRRNPKARTTKARARVERAETALAQKAPERERQAKLELSASRSGKTILELHGLTLERGGLRLMEGLDLFLSEGDRLGVIGKNGCGKSTLLATILGELKPAAGRVVLGNNTRIAYLSQTREGLDGEASVLENVSGGRTQVEYAGKELDVRAYLARFLFDRDKQRQPVASLSGGERTRVALAKLLCEAANLAILDEPTNDLDVSTLSALEEMLLGFGGSAIVVTHDRYFLDRIATAILAPAGDGRWHRYEGDYAHYTAVRPPPAARTRTETPPPAEPKAERTPRRKRALTYADRLELERLPEQIEAAEATVSTLEAELADPALYKDGGEDVAAKTAELGAAREEAERLMARWEELETKAQG